MDNAILRNTNTVPSSILNSISNVIQDLILEQRNILKPTDSFYKERMKLINSSYKMVGSSRFTSGIIDYLKNYYTIDNLNQMIDANKNLIAFNNMLYDFSINDFREIRPNDYISRTTGYDINLKSNGKIRDEINNLILDIFNTKEMCEYYKYIIGSSFFGNTEELLYIHTGVGGNGKGLLSVILGKALGNYYYNTDNKFLTEVKSGANSTLVNGKGKRLLSIQEPEGDNGLNTEFVKLITGETTITTRDLYKSNITYQNLFTPHLQCNDMPQIKKLDGGIIRRLRVINYPNEFVNTPEGRNQKKKDVTLKDKLMKSEYVNEFMLIILNHISSWKDSNFSDIKIPSCVTICTQDYIDENNALRDYINKYIIVTDNVMDRVKYTELYEHFIRHDNNERNLNKKTLINSLLINKINNKIICHKVVYFAGIKINKFDEL